MTTERLTRCQAPGCHNLLHAKGPGRAPKWCSERHRKDTLYARECVDCAAPLSTSGANGPAAPTRCPACNGKHTVRLTERWIVDSIHEWISLFGRPPAAIDWNQALARARGRADVIARYEQTGRPWPPSATVIKRFGSWNAAMLAAGAQPVQAGHRRDPAAHRAALRTAHRTAERDQQVADLYRAGVTLARIATRTGVKELAIVRRLARMRREGWDLPYRKPPHNSNGAS